MKYKIGHLYEDEYIKRIVLSISNFKRCKNPTDVQLREMMFISFDKKIKIYKVSTNTNILLGITAIM
jgi:hypothetical protein